MLKAALFDLDGTLLPVDTAGLIRAYLQSITQAAAAVVAPDRSVQAMLDGTAAMGAERNPPNTNAAAFWQVFDQALGEHRSVLDPIVDNFYATQFDHLARLAKPSPAARQAVEAAAGRNLRMVLATNPVFPLTAIRSRMHWAGVGDLPWDIITGYETMHYCKPHPGYYREIAASLGLAPEECVMVGNDTVEDLAAASLGMRVGIVTDCIIGAPAAAAQADWAGPLSGLAAWLTRLD